MTIKLGSKVKDKITGFIGIATTETRHLTGCDRYGVTPTMDKDGKLGDTKWFDEMVLEVLKEDYVVIEQGEKPGAGADPTSKY